MLREQEVRKVGGTKIWHAEPLGLSGQRVPAHSCRMMFGGTRPRSDFGAWSFLYVFATLDYTKLCYLSLRYLSFRYAALPYITLHFVTLHYVTRHCAALNSTSLHHDYSYICMYTYSCIAVPHIAAHIKMCMYMQSFAVWTRASQDTGRGSQILVSPRMELSIGRGVCTDSVYSHPDVRLSPRTDLQSERAEETQRERERARERQIEGSARVSRSRTGCRARVPSREPQVDLAVGQSKQF